MTRTLNVWIEPVTDRTEADVIELLSLLAVGYANFNETQRQRWKSDLKGALNRSDLLRVTNDLLVVLDILGDITLQYFVVNDDVIMSATDTIVGTAEVTSGSVSEDMIEIPELPNITWYTQLLDYVEYIRDSNYVTWQTPYTPDLPLNDYIKWNDIEKILRDAYSMIKNQIYSYAGDDIYAGDSIGTALI